MSKKIKSFNDKIRPLTDAEKEALEHLRKKGKPLKNEILEPGAGVLKDDTFKAKPNREYQEGKIITEEDLKAEELKVKIEAERFSQEFRRQFTEWAAIDHSVDYEGLSFDHADYLVRIFSMDVKGFEGFITLEYEWSHIIGKFKIKDKPATENVFPIVKILKIGEGVKSTKHKVGDIVLVPSNEILGEDWNPKFLHYMQFQDSKGMNPVLPEGMKQSVPNVQKNWDRFMFIRPWVPQPEEQDKLTYLIPEGRVIGSYNVI